MRRDFLEKSLLRTTNLKYNSSAFTWETFCWFHWDSNWAIRYLTPPLIRFCQEPEVLEWLFIAYQKLLIVASTKEPKYLREWSPDMENKTHGWKHVTEIMTIRHFVLSLIILIYIQWSKIDNCEVYNLFITLISFLGAYFFY